MSTATQTSEELFIRGHEFVTGLSGLETGQFGKEYWKESMCDSCGAKLNLLTRKTCTNCQYQFCASCIQHSGSKSPQICQRCVIFSKPVMKRSQLQTLTHSDLKFYSKRHHIHTSPTLSADDLIEVILSKQVQLLVERTNEAIQELGNVPPGTDINNFDISLLSQYQSTSYSTSGAGGHSIVTTRTRDEADSAPTSQQERLHIRKKPKKAIDYSTVSDIQELDSEDDVSQLSVKQLKTILLRNAINYKGCVEKEELVVKVKTLWRAREEEKKTEAKISETGDTDAENDFLCKVCMDAPVDCVLLDCGHMLTCVRCGRQLAECPVCRQYVVRVVHAFKV